MKKWNWNEIISTLVEAGDWSSLSKYVAGIRGPDAQYTGELKYYTTVLVRGFDYVNGYNCYDLEEHIRVESSEIGVAEIADSFVKQMEKAGSHFALHTNEAFIVMAEVVDKRFDNVSGLFFKLSEKLFNEDDSTEKKEEVAKLAKQYINEVVDLVKDIEN